MQELKKVTVMLPADLLERATMATGKGITPTIREGLEAMAASNPLFSQVGQKSRCGAGSGILKLWFGGIAPYNRGFWRGALRNELSKAGRSIFGA
jgi:hypothetical protein